MIKSHAKMLLSLLLLLLLTGAWVEHVVDPMLAVKDELLDTFRRWVEGFWCSCAMNSCKSFMNFNVLAV
jgi:hypothetical protein